MHTPKLQPWQTAWRYGWAPLLPLAGLQALRGAILKNSPQIIQRSTTIPGPYEFSHPPTHACATAFCLWKDRPTRSCKQIFLDFEVLRRNVSITLEPLGYSAEDFLDWFDTAPRGTMRTDLLPEIDWAIAQKTLQTTLPRT